MSLANALAQVKQEIKVCCDDLAILKKNATDSQNRLDELSIELHLIEEALEKYRGQVEQLNRN